MSKYYNKNVQEHLGDYPNFDEIAEIVKWGNKVKKKLSRFRRTFYQLIINDKGGKQEQ